MKNLLLLSTMAMFATGVSAQQAVMRDMGKLVLTQKISDIRFDNSRPAMEVRAKEMNLNTKAQKVRRRTAATGLYYSRPVGTYFAGFNLEGMGRYEACVCVPPMQELVFENHSDSPRATSWSIVTPQQEVDLNDFADENNNMVWSMTPGSMLYPFVLSNVLGETYVLGQNFNQYYMDPQRTFDDPSKIVSFPYPTYMDAYSAHSELNYCLGGLDTKYLFGTGAITFGEKTSAELGIDPGDYRMKGVITEYDKPASPLYVEDFYAEIFTYYDDPIPVGTEITAVVANAETGEEIATLKATADDLYSLGEQPYGESPTGNIYWKYLDFTQQTTGILGNLVKTPFVIDCPYTVYITGFDQEDVHFGFTAGKNAKRPVEGESLVFEEPLYDTYACFEDANGETFYHPLYSEKGDGFDGLTIHVVLNALFDKVDVLVSSTGTDETGNPTVYTNLNEVEISADGTEFHNHGISSYYGAIVYTACPWIDPDTETDNYFVDLPEWVESIQVDDSNWEMYEGECVIAFTASPLPAGVAGRGALVYINGRGVTSETPVFVFQGDYETALKDIPEGINTVLAPKSLKKGTFSLAGQRVNNAKGLIIEDGKKVIR